MITAQVDQSKGLGARMHGGTEYWIQALPRAARRRRRVAGTGGFTTGHAPVQLDYGVSTPGSGWVHRIGLSYKFGGFYASSRGEPEAFSPPASAR